MNDKKETAQDVKDRLILLSASKYEELRRVDKESKETNNSGRQLVLQTKRAELLLFISDLRDVIG